MEEQLAELAAKVAAIEGKSNVTNTVLAEIYYYVTIPLMVIIHAGFLFYEMGASRQKNVLASGIKNILAFAFMIPTFYLLRLVVIYLGQPGRTALMSSGPNEISGLAYAAEIAWSWIAYMGPNLGGQCDRHLRGRRSSLFAATTASIFSGAVIERIQRLGVHHPRHPAWLRASGSLAPSWAWHGDGWLLTQWGVA